MAFKDFIPESKDPPMLLQLRRQAIRNFPNGKRVALFSNPQLKIQLAIPYDIKSGKLEPSNIMKEELSVLRKKAAKKKADYQSHLADIAKDHGAQSSFEKHAKNAARYSKISESLEDDLGDYMHHEHGAGGTDHVDHGKAAQILHRVTDVHGEKAAKHFAQAAEHLAAGRVGPAQHHFDKFKRITEELLESNNVTADGQVETLTKVYDDLSKKDELSELEAAILGWLTDEIDEYGAFDEMPKDVLGDVADDYESLMAGAEEASDDDDDDVNETYLVSEAKELKSFADWHDAMSKHGEDVAFKMHNSGNSTTASKHGKKLGTYHHDKKTGFVNEDVLVESPLHRINSILNKGAEDKVVFFNGGSARVHPHIAKHVTKLLQTVNSTNKLKLSKLINGSPEGLDKVAKFASTVKY